MYPEILTPFSVFYELFYNSFAEELIKSLSKIIQVTLQRQLFKSTGSCLRSFLDMIISRFNLDFLIKSVIQTNQFYEFCKNKHRQAQQPLQVLIKSVYSCTQLTL